MIEIRNKRGQMAIFIIVAVVLVASISMLFFMNKEPQSDHIEADNPVPYVELCAKSVAQEALDIMLPQGGFIEPKNYKSYNGDNITYLCENVGYFKPCINQHPVLLNEVKDELYEYSYSKIDECFLDLQEQLEERGAQVSIGEMNLSYSLGPDRVRIYVTRELNIADRGQNYKFEEYNVEFLHPVYDLVNVANDIVSQEAKYCYFEYVGYMLLYPRFDIKKVALSDSTKIYSIEDINSKTQLNIALRGCAIPAGI